MAVAYLHNRRPSAIIHRDIKPSNVLITRSGVAKLTDFGLSRVVADMSKHAGETFLVTPAGLRSGRKSPQDVPLSPKVKRDSSGGDKYDKTSVVGTFPYAAPESNLRTYDCKVDIYSCAVTFYELFEQTRFDDEMGFGYAMTPNKVAKLITKMGFKSPTDRPTALELIDAFQATKLAKTPAFNSGCNCNIS